MTETLQLRETSTEEILRIFQLQQGHYLEIGKTTAKERMAKLDRLHQAILKYRPQIREAMYADFRKPALEVDVVEVYPITSAIKHARTHLRRWMRPKKTPTPVAFFGSSSWIQYEPKGVCLIISPWNFPFNLSFIPLISAIAAGNCVLLKPSEHTPHSSALIQKIAGEVFDEREVAVIEGGIETSQALLELPFNHIFFTGSPQVGKIVMAAAAKNLASVTLELGGKSPTIIDETADIKAAAERTIRGKMANSGQICIAPDYVFVHENMYESFVTQARESIREFFGTEIKSSNSYARMVNMRQYGRVKSQLEDALSLGAELAAGGQLDDRELYIEPTILSKVSPEARVMQEEIFGPVLPVITFRNLQEPIDFINKGERPLTMSIFSKNKKNIRRLIEETRAGGTAINHAQLHFYNHDLPFGGINNSGIGKSHGRFGFAAFSNARSFYKQYFWGPTELLKPPYTKFKEWVIDFTIKWL